MGKRRRQHEHFNCPHCGAELPAGAKFCRECGADDEMGWNEEDASSAADLPEGYSNDDDFDYDDFVRREFPDQADPTARSSRSHRLWVAIVLILCAAFLLWVILQR